MSNSIEWTKDIFYLVGKSLKILEIYFTSKSNFNKNFIDVFFEENSKCKYYGIIKYNEKNIKENKNYFYYEEDPKIVLNKFIENNKYFDIIIINLLLLDKLNNILYYCILSIELLNDNIEMIHWYTLSKNPNAIEILKKNNDKIKWYNLSSNPSIFELDYNKIKQNFEVIEEEILKEVLKPNRVIRNLELYGYDIEDMYD